MNKLIGAAIIGGTGYGAGELLRVLTQHPEVDVVSVVSASSAGTPIARTHSHLLGFYNLAFDAQLNTAALAAYQKKVVFLALPHGASAQATNDLLPELEKLGALLVDLSGDFRLGDQGIRAKYYPEAGASGELQKRFVYGLSELNRDAITQATFLSTPGCLASVCILAAAPVLHSNSTLASTASQAVFNILTGTSGGGKSLNEAFHYSTRHGSSVSYKVLEHRHEPEVLQALGDPFGERIRSSFVPHLLPTSRGCSVTLHLELNNQSTSDELLAHYRSFYETHPFIRLREAPPEYGPVIGTNFCDIGVKVRGKQAVIMAALDNLGKGTAGQAVQNLNLALGLPETTGLWTPALGPC